MLPSMNHNARIKYHHHESRSIEHHHLRAMESRSILTGGVGRVRSQFLEFGDNYLHKPAPTDPIINTIDRNPTHIFAYTGS